MPECMDEKKTDEEKKKEEAKVSNRIRMERLKFRGTQLNTAVVLIDEWESYNVHEKEHAITTPGIHVSCLPNISLNAIFYIMAIWIAEILQNKRFWLISFLSFRAFESKTTSSQIFEPNALCAFVACVTPCDDIYTLIGGDILKDRCISEMWCTFSIYPNGCFSRSNRCQPSVEEHVFGFCQWKAEENVHNVFRFLFMTLFVSLRQIWYTRMFISLNKKKDPFQVVC